MSMRITQDVLFQNSLFYLQRGYQGLEKAQLPLLTGYKINRPSDDPYGATKVIKFRAERREIANHISNIDMARGVLESSASSLQSLSALIIEARAITVQGASSGPNQTDREALAIEIDHILAGAVAIADTRFGGRYLFGGAYTGNPPYAYDGKGRVDYLGDSNVTFLKISPGSRVALNIPGPEIFQKMDRGPTIYQGSTGAAAGSGTDNGTANAVLRVLHGTTAYAAGSGVAAGIGSAAADTIIGALGTHTLTLNVDASGLTGTVALDGGDPVAFDVSTHPSPDRFEVTNEEGDRVLLDLTGLVGGFSGAVDITSTGFLTTDGGATQIPIDFSSNQLAVNSGNGSVTNVNSSGIVRTGEEYLTYTGAFDLFEVLTAIRDDLRNTRDLPEEEQLASIAMRLTELDDAHNDVLAAMAEFGGRSNQVQMTKTRLENFDLNLATLLVETAEIDLSEAAMNLERANQSLQLAQAVASQILQISLLGKI